FFGQIALYQARPPLLMVNTLIFFFHSFCSFLVIWAFALKPITMQSAKKKIENIFFMVLN
ncbi:MAG: hypothetical protein AAFO69_03995, partial [Bacteroidota bacterium]